MGARLDLVNNILDDNTQIKRAIKQGNDYQLRLQYEGDISAGTFLGQIRRNTVDNQGGLLADFSFSSTFDGVYTNIVAKIAGEVTETIPATKYDFTINQFEKDGQLFPEFPDQPIVPPSAKNCWFYDLKVVLPDSQEIGLIDFGLVEVIGRFTED